jgi:hypothetical protein
VDQGGEYTFVFPHTKDPVSQGYGWEVNDESSGFVTVDNQGTVEVPVKEWRESRTKLPQYQTENLDHAEA